MLVEAGRPAPAPPPQGARTGSARGLSSSPYTSMDAPLERQPSGLAVDSAGPASSASAQVVSRRPAVRQ